MEERLKVEVQISSYDAKGLQCFVAEQIQKYRPEESGPKKMFKKVAGSLVKRIPCQAELQLALNVLSVPAVNRNLSRDGGGQSLAGRRCRYRWERRRERFDDRQIFLSIAR